jgi:hypothetical protein
VALSEASDVKVILGVNIEKALLDNFTNDIAEREMEREFGG